MRSEKGFQNQKKKGPAQHKTIQSVGSNKYGENTVQMYLYDVTPAAIAIVSAAVDNADPDKVYIEIPNHQARNGDILRIIGNSAMGGWEFEIIEILSPDIIGIYNIGEINGVAQIPQVGELAKTARWITAKADSEGALTTSSGPTQFVRNGVTTTVNEDTVTPANNRPIPSGLYFVKNGLMVPVTDSATPSEVAAIPVTIKATDGTNITITAGDINIQTTSEGLTFDSQRIGDGSGVFLKIEADGKIGVKNIAEVLAELQTLNGKDFASQTTLNAILTAFNSEDFASETKLEQVRVLLNTINGKDFATQTTLAALLAAFSGEDFASETKLEQVRLLLASLDGKDFATQASLTALSGKFGSLGQKASAGSAPVVLSTEQETILSSLATKLDTLIASNAVRTIHSIVNFITSASPITAPAGAKGFIIQNSTISNGALRWGLNAGTVNAANGFYLGVGQSTSYIDGASTLKIHDVDALGIDCAVVWFI